MQLQMTKALLPITSSILLALTCLGVFFVAQEQGRRICFRTCLSDGDDAFTRHDYISAEHYWAQAAKQLDGDELKDLHHRVRRLECVNESNKAIKLCLLVDKKKLHLNSTIDSADYACLVNELGLLYHRQNKTSEARIEFLEAIRMRETAKVKDFRDAAYFSNLADVYFEETNYIEAERYYRLALSLRRQLFSEDSAIIARTINALATVCLHQKHCKESEELALKALKLSKKVTDGYPPELINVRAIEILADTYLLQGRTAWAERLYKMVLTLCTKYNAQIAEAQCENLTRSATNSDYLPSVDAVRHKLSSIRGAL